MNMNEHEYLGHTPGCLTFIDSINYLHSMPGKIIRFARKKDFDILCVLQTTANIITTDNIIQ